MFSFVVICCYDNPNPPPPPCKFDSLRVKGKGKKGEVNKWKERTANLILSFTLLRSAVGQLGVCECRCRLKELIYKGVCCTSLDVCVYVSLLCAFITVCAFGLRMEAYA